jgi:hypothetical protein
MRWLVLTSILAVACERSEPAPGVASATPSTRPAASATPHANEPLEELEKLPLLALSQWTQGRDASIPDIPRFTLYDDGSVVAWREQGGRGAFVEAALDSGAREALMTAVQSSGILAIADDHHGEQRATHLPSTTVMVRHSGRWKRVTVEGFVDGAMMDGQTHPPPAPFIAVHRKLESLPLPEAKPWQHRHVMVHARVETASNKPLPWPADLPEPGASTFPPGDERNKRYVVAAKHEQAARDALSGEQPFDHDGKAWRVVAVEPTLEAWTYLERLRYMSAYPRSRP